VVTVAPVNELVAKSVRGDQVATMAHADFADALCLLVAANEMIEPASDVFFDAHEGDVEMNADSSSHRAVDAVGHATKSFLRRVKMLVQHRKLPVT
jgi:hypothetical protein